MYEKLTLIAFGMIIGGLIFGPTINLEEQGGNDESNN